MFAPRVTRFIASVFAAVTLSDFLQHLYIAAKGVPGLVQRLGGETGGSGGKGR